MSTLDLRLVHAEALTPRVRRFVLATVDGRPFPAYTPGAHVEVEVWPAGAAQPLHRAYSLVSPWEEGDRCEIAVQLEPEGSGGSRWMHELQVGAVVKTTGPRNEFELRPHQRAPLLVAAGIGITPILCMARALGRQGSAFEFHYLARDREQAAFLADIEAMPGARCWFDGGDPTAGPALAELIGSPSVGRHLYVCGPKGLIAATLDTARRAGWPEEALHCELFAGSLDGQGDRPFIVELSGSGQTLEVAVGQSVMEALEAAGLDPIFDCRRGECGICATQVLAGEADHRDICLSDHDHEAGLFCTCVSRARSERLVLDL